MAEETQIPKAKKATRKEYTITLAILFVILWYSGLIDHATEYLLTLFKQDTIETIPSRFIIVSPLSNHSLTAASGELILPLTNIGTDEVTIDTMVIHNNRGGTCTINMKLPTTLETTEVLTVKAGNCSGLNARAGAGYTLDVFVNGTTTEKSWAYGMLSNTARRMRAMGFSQEQIDARLKEEEKGIKKREVSYEPAVFTSTGPVTGTYS